ncbi:MAG: adenine deaminase [Candidatus Omnitrophota bacterium]
MAAGILFSNGRVVDVVGKRIVRKDVMVKDGKICLSFSPDDADEVIDLKGAYISPGFIDGHIHIESSMLTPLEFAYEAVRHGTTSVFVDPHEIANVLGRKGIDLFLDQAGLVPFTMNIGIPSCVPATGMETAGGVISVEDIEELLKDERVYGLAEMMNFPGIVYGLGDARGKVRLALKAGKIADGHAPGLSGSDLALYISNGELDGEVRISSDHECTHPAEAVEKWEKGMYIMLRHGSAAKDLENILPEVCREVLNLENFGLVSDDLSAADLRSRGHMNYLVNKAAAIIEKERGCDAESAVIEAISMATVNHARHFRKNTGVIEEGASGDIVVFDSLSDIKPSIVLSRGRVVARDGKYTGDRAAYDYTGYRHPVKVPALKENILAVKSDNLSEKVRVIGVKAGSLLTEEIIEVMPVRHGEVSPPPENGITKVAVLERHKGTGNIAVGFVKGFDFAGGAIASTVAHDSHNLIVAGKDARSMLKAINRVKEEGGGLAAVFNGKEEALPLKLGGLMSLEDINKVLEHHEKLDALIKEMGFKTDPFATLSFLALPVIPKLKITDEGLVDVEQFDFVNLFV